MDTQEHNDPVMEAGSGSMNPPQINYALGSDAANWSTTSVACFLIVPSFAGGTGGSPVVRDLQGGSRGRCQQIQQGAAAADAQKIAGERPLKLSCKDNSIRIHRQALPINSYVSGSQAFSGM